MKALRYENQKLLVKDIPRPEADGEVLVRVTLAGICNTDLEITRGYAGFQGTIGHEFVGVIESLPEAGAVALPSGRAISESEPSLTRGLLTLHSSTSASGRIVRISKIEIIGRKRMNKNRSAKKNPIVPMNMAQSHCVG